MTTGYTKTKGPRQDRRTRLRLSRGNKAPPATAHRHHQQPFFQLFLIPETLRQHLAVPGALCAGHGHGRSRGQQHSGPSGTQAEPRPRLPALELELGIRTEKGKGAPQPARPPAAALPRGLWALSYCRLTAGWAPQPRLPEPAPARPLKAVNLHFQTKTR